MRAVIIGNGDIHNYEYIKTKLRKDDFIICADGGLRHTSPLGVSPDIAIGDFDSSSKNETVKTYEYPIHKDFTDGELAVNYALENGYNEIILLAMTGKRLDHTLTNLFQLTKGNNICLIDDNNEIHLLSGSITLNGLKGKTMSLIPIFSNLKEVYLSGTLYPLNGETLYFGEGRGNSNIITEDICTISAKDGMGLIFINNGE